MKKYLNHKPKRSKQEKGQALVIIAVAFVVLLVFVGLAVDTGQLFIYMGHLRRSVDAAALAAAAQYREGRTLAQMTDSAEEVMNLNGVEPTTVIVETCETSPGDPSLCFTPRRKLARVTGTIPVPMSFLRLIGYYTIPISADAIAEAASMDVVLVIDFSESMADDASLCDGDDDDGDGVADDGRPDGWCPGGLPAVPQSGDDWDNLYADPSKCNPPVNGCHPMVEVKEAAISFIERVLDEPVNKEADRLAIVQFSSGWEVPSDRKGTQVLNMGGGNGWTTNRVTAINAIDNMMIYQPPHACPGSGDKACLSYDDDGNYLGFGCPPFQDFTPGDASPCTTTNIGGGMQFAGNQFAAEPREDALWVVVLLTDGAANSSPQDMPDHEFGYCPDPTNHEPPFCRDDDSSLRHSPVTDPDYNADDFARDMADFVGCYPVNPAPACNGTIGQGAVTFAIGLGPNVLDTFGSDPIAHGVSLLRYTAAVGDDGNPATDPCEDLYDNESEWQEWCGNYYFAPTGDDLDEVFEDIASRIFTRITH